MQKHYDILSLVLPYLANDWRQLAAFAGVDRAFRAASLNPAMQLTWSIYDICICHPEGNCLYCGRTKIPKALGFSLLSFVWTRQSVISVHSATQNLPSLLQAIKSSQITQLTLDISDRNSSLTPADLMEWLSVPSGGNSDSIWTTSDSGSSQVASSGSRKSSIQCLTVINYSSYCAEVYHSVMELIFGSFGSEVERLEIYSSHTLSMSMLHRLDSVSELLLHGNINIPDGLCVSTEGGYASLRELHIDHNPLDHSLALSNSIFFDSQNETSLESWLNTQDFSRLAEVSSPPFASHQSHLSNEMRDTNSSLAPFEQSESHDGSEQQRPAFENERRSTWSRLAQVMSRQFPNLASLHIDCRDWRDALVLMCYISSRTSRVSLCSDFNSDNSFVPLLNHQLEYLLGQLDKAELESFDLFDLTGEPVAVQTPLLQSIIYRK